MRDVLIGSPFIPREWVAAHGLRPRVWFSAPPREIRSDRSFMGVCAYAEALLHTALTEPSPAVVFATTCDQMRRAADDAASFRTGEVFLMNIPATWQAPASRQLYRSEIERLGRFLIRIGGQAPSRERLREEMRRHRQAREILRNSRAILTGRQFAEALSADWLHGSVSSPQKGLQASGSVPLAIIGEALPPSHLELFDWIEICGGQVALNATTWGERCLIPDPQSDCEESASIDPLAALVDAYFNGIIDAFQRPNTRLYDWLRPRLRERGIRGIILWNYPWCDLWRAEQNRLADEFQLPVLHLDPGDGGALSPSMKTRIEAFLELLHE